MSLWRTSGDESPGAAWNALIPLAAILLLAALLRLPAVNQPLVDLFCWREASTAMMADNFHLKNWNVLYPEVSWTGPGPNYQGREFQVVSYITALLYAAFGWHDWFGRAVAAAFGLWSVVALHRLVERLSGRAQANAAALVLALMPGAVIIDTSFLPDPAMLAFVLTGLWALVVWLQTDRPWFLPLAVAFIALGILAKPPGVVVLAPAAYACASILTRRDALTRGRLIALSAALVGVALPTAAYFSWAVWLGTHYPPYHVAGAGYFWDDMAGALREGFHVKAAARHAREWFLTVPVFLLFGLGLFSAPPRGTRGAPWLFHVWLAGCAVLYLFISKEMTVNPWNLLVFAAPAAGLAGRGLLMAAAASTRRLNTWPARARLAGMVALIGWSAVEAAEVAKQPFGAESQYLGQQLDALAAPDDLVITAASEIGNPIAIYYSRRRGWVFPPGGGAQAWDRVEDDATAVATLEKLRMGGADWFGMAKDAMDHQGRYMMQHNPGLIARLDSVGARVVDDDRIVIWRLPPVTPGA
ncbi:glycosyltransferase family 39 protein [Caulobacter sp. 17J65-9]|uniref:ArnT family glycosyltransferase n=1 Tax=Caulobacter sp. 17J65-9 TaxID=2709382 RepID=UPI0013CBAF72|nr:glycosyltransferase family 39 protein [Caulobacter sp. 17J65-9]NEX92259.1 glycosyl transferase [Caulobacter sp. 17J65-9]